MNRQNATSTATAALLLCLGVTAGTSPHPPINVTGTDFSTSDARDVRTESSPPEQWMYDTMPTPAPSGNPGARLNEIAFGDNSTALDREGIAVCRQMAAQIRSMNGTRFLVVGFSHEMEPDPGLGQRRADAVRSAMAGNGLSASRIETASFGSRFSGVFNSPHPYMRTSAQGVEIWTLK